MMGMFKRKAEKMIMDTALKELKRRVEDKVGEMATDHRWPLGTARREAERLTAAALAAASFAAAGPAVAGGRDARDRARRERAGRRTGRVRPARIRRPGRSRRAVPVRLGQGRERRLLGARSGRRPVRLSGRDFPASSRRTAAGDGERLGRVLHVPGVPVDLRGAGPIARIDRAGRLRSERPGVGVATRPAGVRRPRPVASGAVRPRTTGR